MAKAARITGDKALIRALNNIGPAINARPCRSCVLTLLRCWRQHRGRGRACVVRVRRHGEHSGDLVGGLVNGWVVLLIRTVSGLLQ